MNDKLKRVWKFVSNDIWDIELSSLSAIRSFGVKSIRVLHLVFKGFREDECPLQASALTFSTVMAIVPVLALSLALARGLGDAETAKEQFRGAVENLTQNLRSQAAATTNTVPDTAISAENETNGSLSPSVFAAEIDKMVDLIFDKVENVNFGAIGGTGLVILLFMVVQVLGQVESSFNRVWGVTTGRPIWRKFTDYISVMVVMPVLVVAASSVKIADIVTRFVDESWAAGIRTVLSANILTSLTVVIMTTLCFMFVIIFMPHSKVKAKPAFAGGFVSAMLFILWMKICALVQVAAFIRYGNIYGTFAVVPITLLWVYVSWNILLFGAEVAFAMQNCTTYTMERGAHKANVQSRIMLALSIIAEAGKAMLKETPNFEISSFAREKRIPVRFLNDMVNDLIQAGFLAKLSETKNNSFVLLKSPEHLKVGDIVDAVMRSGVEPQALGLSNIDPRIEKVLKKATESLDNSLQKTTVQDLISEAE
ncbi:YhjD/YihY/BrkB family envelope integrity protein [Verrucomicrobiota bacterium]